MLTATNLSGLYYVLLDDKLMLIRIVALALGAVYGVILDAGGRSICIYTLYLSIAYCFVILFVSACIYNNLVWDWHLNS